MGNFNFLVLGRQYNMDNFQINHMPVGARASNFVYIKRNAWARIPARGRTMIALSDTATLKVANFSR